MEELNLSKSAPADTTHTKKPSKKPQLLAPSLSAEPKLEGNPLA